MAAYYNENNPIIAKWLRELISDGRIAPGDVDERSIEDVIPSDLAPYQQCHFFAGIGGWSYALRLAGWPDDKPIWTGSAPCQPFSTAGKGSGFADERHLWPAWFWIIKQCRPSIIIGEQVGRKNGLAWWDVVASDLESNDYSCGAIVLPATIVGAPHKRERIYWLATNSTVHGREGLQPCFVPQVQENRPPETLVTWDNPGNPFAEWRVLMGEPNVCRMAHGVSSTVDIRPRLHAYGNAIVPQLAAEFIRACMGTI